jgi:primase-polymerase (primpol)-like protein
VNPRDIPEELRTLPNWVVWKEEKRTNKSGIVQLTKVPYCARSGPRSESDAGNAL